MHNQSLFVKLVIWLMIFLMSIGFAALVISPFVGNISLFGGGDGTNATQELLDESRAKVEKDHCVDAKEKITGARLKRCQSALRDVAASYTSLATPADGATEVPRDSKRNYARAGDAYKALYELDESNLENAALYAGYLRDSGDSKNAVKLWTKLVKADPENEDYLLQQAGAYEQAGDTDKAIATLRTFIKRFPDSGQISSIKDQIKSLQDKKSSGGLPDGLTATTSDGTPVNIG